jgi:hypothetical protein
MTYFGINPSFVNGRLPLLANGIARDRYFRVFNAQGEPTAEKSLVGLDGWPIHDGRLHGVKVFSEMAGTMPKCTAEGMIVKEREGELFWVCAKDLEPGDKVKVAGQSFKGWHVPSLAELAKLKPVVLRTLDWERTNEKRDWSQPRVTHDWPIQGNGMAVELQADAANLLKCHLWWCAPARFELSEVEYEQKLEEMLRVLQSVANKPPVLQWSNELWNGGFPVHNWLKKLAADDPVGPPWHYVAAREIAILKKVAHRVFGQGPLGPTYYLFVDGQLTVPSHLDNLLEACADLGFLPDMAGPALYATPTKESRLDWQASGAIPTMDELRRSVETRLGHMWTDLKKSADIVAKHGVPYLGVYESGQSFIARDERGQPLPWRKTAIEAQREEWLKDVYLELRDMANTLGVTICNWYSAMTDQEPKDGRIDVFGLLEGMGKPWLPKAEGAIGQT